MGIGAGCGLVGGGHGGELGEGLCVDGIDRVVSEYLCQGCLEPHGPGGGRREGGLEWPEVPIFTQHCSLQPSLRRIWGKVVPGRTMRLRMSIPVLGQAGAWRILELGGMVDP